MGRGSPPAFSKRRAMGSLSSSLPPLVPSRSLLPAFGQEQRQLRQWMLDQVRGGQAEQAHRPRVGLGLAQQVARAGGDRRGIVERARQGARAGEGGEVGIAYLERHRAAPELAPPQQGG